MTSSSIVVTCIGFVFDPVAQTIIRSIAPEGFDLRFAEKPGELMDADLAASDFLMTVAPVTEPMIKSAGRLRMIQKWGVGYDKIDLQAAERHGVTVAITAGANANTIAEHAVLLMLAVLRRLILADGALRAGRWIPAELRPQSRTLSGKTVGIVGFGNIGQAVARQLGGFGVRLVYHDRKGDLGSVGKEFGASYAALPQLLAQSDIVTLHCPGGAGNRHLINPEAMNKMKRGAVIINAARGDLIDEEALADALATGQISGAGLDVFETEPLGPGSRLRALDNVVLTPHSAGSVMDDVAPMASHGFANMGRFLRGEPIPAADLIVNPAPAARDAMKITEVVAHPLAMDYAEPCWTAHERFDRARLILVEVRTDQGIVGVGEIAGGPQNLVCDLVQQFAAVAKGMNALDHEGIWNTLMSATSPRPGGLGGWDGLPAPLPRHHRPQVMAAIAGIDIALWDIKGKAAGLPVYRVLGGTRREVFTYAVGGFYVEGAPLQACADELGQYAAQGYRAVKLKTGALSLADETERVRAVRAAIGPDVLLMLDMNAPYDVEGCIDFARAVAPYDIFWLEEPLHWYLQPVDFVRLAAGTAIPLAHGEREWHRFTVRDFIDSGAIRYVQFDATRYAGFTEALRVADYARQKSVSVSPHSAAHIHGHLVSAFGDAAFAAESVGRADRHPIHHRVYQGGAEVKNGTLHLSDAPGFGLEVDWKQVKSLRE